MSGPKVLSTFPAQIKIEVAWGDMDSFGHVNNTVFFRYFESVRIAYFQRIGLAAKIPDAGPAPILANISCRFRRPLFYPDTIIAGSRITRLLKDRFFQEHILYSMRQATVAATGVGEIVAYDYQNKQRATIPDNIKTAILDLESSVGNTIGVTTDKEF